jgi:hypothetical protein
MGTQQATASLTVDTEGSNAVTCTATDSAQNSGAAPGSSNSATINIDGTPPTLACGEADGAWHKDDVDIACSASDGGSSLANPADASFNLGTSVAIDTETDDASTDSRVVCDVAGNCVTAGPIGGHKVDKKAPSIRISSPANTAYLLGQVVAADYACTDGSSGVASCTGPVASGAAIDTASVGSKSFAVNTRDMVGNSASASVAYNVIYDWTGFFPPVDNLPTFNVAKAGSAIPVKFSLGSNQGLDIFAAAYPKVTTIVCPSSAPFDDIDQTVTASSNSLNYDPATDQYNFVWKTNKAWAGTCRQLVVRLLDGTDHLANFKFR